MTEELKFSFDYQTFDISSGNIKNSQYAELNYPQFDNKISKPVIKYNEIHYFPIRILITGKDASDNYICVLETKDKDNTKTLYVSFKLIHDNTVAVGPLTEAFDALNNTQKKTVNINLHNVFKDTNFANGKIFTSSTAPNYLTLHITTPITYKLYATAPGIPNTSISTIINTYTPEAASGGTDILIKESALTVRQRCTRASDNASPSVSVVPKSKTPNYLTNLLFVMIMCLTVAGFYSPIYSGLVCFFAPKGDKHGAIHIIYLIAVLSLVIPLFVRGFKDGDLDSQIWGAGLVVLALIFYMKYNEMSNQQILKCGGVVANMSMSEQISQFFRLFTDSSGKLNYKLIGLIVFVLCGLASFLITASIYSTNEDLYKGMMGGMCFLIFILLFGVKYLAK